MSLTATSKSPRRAEAASSSASNPSPLSRFAGNPILTPNQMPFECSCVFNAGAVRFQNRTLLLLRAEDYSRQTRFHVATSTDGIHFDVNPQPIRYPMRDVERAQSGHRFDMRITPLDGAFYVC